jgi:four helix bundle protein
MSKEDYMVGKRIERFEDLIAWQKARALTGRIYEITNAGQLKRDLGLKDQIQRASVSIMANIAEGFERGRASEFHQFLSVAKASCAELRSHLYVALDAAYLHNDEFGQLKIQAEEVGRVVGGLRASAQRRRDNS